MNGRKWVRLPFALALVFGLALSVVAEASAQTAEPTPTDTIAECVNNAADSFVECTEESNRFGDVLCGIKYAADAILCMPPRLLK